jgi:hypothetical protein
MIRPRTAASRRATSTSLGGSRSGTKRCEPSRCSAKTALTKRDANADPMLEFFDFAAPPFMTPPELPAATIDPDHPGCTS